MSIEFIARSGEKWLISDLHRESVRERDSYSLLQKNRKKWVNSRKSYASSIEKFKSSRYLQIYMGARESFLKAYANLPEPEREQIIAVLDNKSYSWNVAKIEIEHNTTLGKQILKKMEEIGLL